MDVRTSETTKDYSVYELLLGPPRPGDVIAYKVLILIQVKPIEAVKCDC